MNHKNGGNNVLLILQNDKIFPVEANEHSIAFPIRRSSYVHDTFHYTLSVSLYVYEG